MVASIGGCSIVQPFKCWLSSPYTHQDLHAWSPSPQDFPSFLSRESQDLCCAQPYSLRGEDEEVAYFLEATRVLYFPLQSYFKPVCFSMVTKGLAGIELGYTGHSTRGASTSAADAAGLSVELILEAADWASAQTFERFYHREQSSGFFPRQC